MATSKAGSTTTICSKLPHGLKITHPIDRSQSIEIKGTNSGERGRNGQRILIPYGLTEVDKEFWDAWYAVHNHPTKPFGPLASGAIWEAKTVEAAKPMFRERENQLTGVEPMEQQNDPRMGADGKGLKPADKD